MSDVANAQAGAGDAGASAGAADKAADTAAKDTAPIINGQGGAQAPAGGDDAAGKGAEAGAVKDAAAAAPDWRTRMAGEDKDALKRLERFSTEADVYKSFRALEAKMSSGEFKRALAENATDEEKATWRKENGIPDKPEGYVEKIALPKGMVLGEDDKPLAAEFAAAAAEANMTPAQYSRMVAQYYNLQDQMKAKQEEADATFKDEADLKLRDMFGPDYRRELNAVNNLVAAMPEGLAGRLLSGRMADGRRVGDDPAMVAWLASHARELNPAATLLPAGTSDPAKGVNGRIAEIETMMKDRSGEYYRGPKADGLQKEYRDLITARDTMKARAA